MQRAERVTHGILYTSLHLDAGWHQRREEAISLFAFSPKVQGLICTARANERLHSVMHKAIHNQGLVPVDEATTWLILLTLRNNTEPWTWPPRGVASYQKPVRHPVRRTRPVDRMTWQEMVHTRNSSRSPTIPRCAASGRSLQAAAARFGKVIAMLLGVQRRRTASHHACR